MCPHSTIVPSGVVVREVSSESDSMEKPLSLTHQAQVGRGVEVWSELSIVCVSSLYPFSHRAGNVCGVVCSWVGAIWLPAMFNNGMFETCNSTFVCVLDETGSY